MELTAQEREQQADEHGKQAISLRMAGQTAEALSHADQGVALVESLLAERPGDPSTMHVLASQLYTRAAIQGQVGQPERGVADARRSMELYEQLAPLDGQVADLDARATPRAADAMARMARLIALAPEDPTQNPGVDRATEACDAIVTAVRVYTDLAAAEPHYRTSLARMLFGQSEVFRIVGTLDGQDTTGVVLMSCINALEIYWSPDYRLEDAGRSFYAMTLLQAARLHRHENADRLDMADVANKAAEQFLSLVTAGGNYHGDLVESLHLLSEILEDSGAPDRGRPLVSAQNVLAQMSRPLPDEIAAIEQSIEERLRRAGG